MQFTNQLIHSSSPYLLQHAHNPVNWNTWNPEILKKANEEDKPILVSIGYSACHWCHVMEKESFEDEATAAIMNEKFINIKIDREERPDLDHIYMDALQAMTGSGGWPLNIFITPQLKPFFGGTYFPPSPAYGRMSWKDTLLAVSKAFMERRDEIEQQSNNLTQHLIQSNSLNKLSNSDTHYYDYQKAMDDITENLFIQADEVWGGFGNAPKFPQTSSIAFLLAQYHFTKNDKCLQQALLSLNKMLQGGIYDHVGGGFSRYSTDEKWFAPHFEKMLYDNALIVGVLCDAYQITKSKIFEKIIHQTLAFVERELMSSEYAFFSAIDADSEGLEGKFYTWDKKEIENLLGADAQIFCEIFNVSNKGNWEHRNILWLTDSIENISKKLNIPFDSLDYKIESWKSILFSEREKRIRPQLDDKILTSWNAMMNNAFCKAYAATGNEHYRFIAERNMYFLQTKILCKERLMHCYKNGKSYISGFLDDYAYTIKALIQIQEITGKSDYLVQASALMKTAIEKFNNISSPFFYFTEEGQDDIVVRKVDLYDGATPSANSVMAYCCNYLSSVFYDEKLRNRSLDMIHHLLPAITKHPTSFSHWAIMTQNLVHKCKEIVVIGPGSNVALASIIGYFMPNKILIASTKSNIALPILINKGIEGETLFYLCENHSCREPVKSLSKFLHLYNI